MKIFYDNHFFYSYICFSEYNEQEIQFFIELLKSNGIEVLRIFNPPRYPASDGIMYAFLLQISYKNPAAREKYSSAHIDKVIKQYFFERSTEIQVAQNEKEQNEFLLTLRKEFNYINTIKVFLESERKILEADRKIVENDKKLAKTQLKELSALTANLQKENSRIHEIFLKNSEKLSKDISDILSKRNVSNKELLALNEQLKEKELSLKNREKTLRLQEREFNEILQEKYDYFESLEDDFALRELALKEKEEQYEKEYHERFKELKNSFDNAQRVMPTEPAQDLRIFVLGDSALNSRQIYEVFNSHYAKAFNFPLENYVINSQYISYEDIKGLDIPVKLKSDKFDYVVIGPLPHSNKGKEESKHWKNFFKENKLKALPFISMSKMLSKSDFDHLAKTIVDDWQNKMSNSFLLS